MTIQGVQEDWRAAGNLQLQHHGSVEDNRCRSGSVGVQDGRRDGVLLMGGSSKVGCYQGRNRELEIRGLFTCSLVRFRLR